MSSYSRPAETTCCIGMAQKQRTPELLSNIGHTWFSLACWRLSSWVDRPVPDRVQLQTLGLLTQFTFPTNKTASNTGKGLSI